MKYVSVVSEREFDMLAFDVQESARQSLWEMWASDLNVEMSPPDLIRNANSILTYFGSNVVVTDVRWDKIANCFLWEIEFDA